MFTMSSREWLLIYSTSLPIVPPHQFRKDKSRKTSPDDSACSGRPWRCHVSDTHGRSVGRRKGQRERLSLWFVLVILDSISSSVLKKKHHSRKSRAHTVHASLLSCFPQQRHVKTHRTSRKHLSWVARISTTCMRGRNSTRRNTRWPDGSHCRLFPASPSLLMLHANNGTKRLKLTISHSK